MTTALQDTDSIQSFVNSLASSKTGKAGAVRFGQQARTHVEGTSYFAITLNKKDFATLLGRTEAYQHIPKAGAFAMANVGVYIQNDVVKEAFDTQGHGKWAKLQPSTIKWRKRVGEGPSPILSVKKFYRDGLIGKNVWKTAVVGPYARLEYDPEKLSNAASMYPGVNSPKASVRTKFFVHQLGSSNIPARRVFPAETGDLTNAQQRAIKTTLELGMLDWLDNYPTSKYWKATAFKKYKRGK